MHRSATMSPPAAASIPRVPSRERPPMADKAGRDAQFAEYMAARQPALLRTAYLLSGDSHTAAATETFWRCAPRRVIDGVCPSGAQVRRSSGPISSPLSSIRAIPAPCRRAFL